MLKKVTHIISEYSESGEKKLDSVFEAEQPTEEEIEQRRIDRLTGKLDYEEEDYDEIKTVKLEEEDFIIVEQEGLIDTSNISYAHKTADDYTFIMTKQDKTVIIKESPDYLAD